MAGHKCDVTVFKGLITIRERLPHADWAHIRALCRLVEYVRSKPPDRDVTTEQVAPGYTSQRCSHIDCGFRHENNRDSEQFRCPNCRYEVHAEHSSGKA